MRKKAIVILVAACMALAACLASAPVPAKAAGATELGDFIVQGGVNSVDYSFASGVLTILTSTPVTVKNKDQSVATQHRIVVKKDVSANVTLAGVNIAADSTYNKQTPAPFLIEDESKGAVVVTLEKGTVNVLKGHWQSAGLQKRGGIDSGTLTIKGTGSLEAIGGRQGAGIGSYNISENIGAYHIYIEGGVITARGGSGSAGIGCGLNENKCGDIRIYGGSVKASGGSAAAQAIGCGAINSASGGLTPVVYTPTSDGTTPVFCQTIANESGEPVYIDGKKYPASHGSETNIYPYMTPGKHIVTINDEDCLYEISSNGEIESKTNYTISFNVNGGSVYIRTTPVKNRNLPLNVSDNEREGYVLIGWIYKGQLVGKYTTYAEVEPDITVTNITITAVWSPTAQTMQKLDDELSVSKSELQALIDKKADATTLNQAIEKLNSDIAKAKEAADAAEEAAKLYADEKDKELKSALDAAIKTAKEEAISAANTAVENAKTELTEAIGKKADTETVNAAIETLNTAISNAEAAAKAYAELKSALEATIKTAKEEAISAANTAVENAKTELQEAIGKKADTETVNAAIETLNTAISNAEAAANAYADEKDKELKSALEASIKTAKEEAISAANTAVENAKTELNEAIGKKADTETVNAAIKTLNTAISNAETTAKAYADEKDGELRTALEATIKTAKEDAISTANTAVENAKTELQEAIGKKADTETVNAAIGTLNTAISNAEAAAKVYADEKDKELKSALEAAIASAKEALTAAIDEVKANLETAKTELIKAIGEGDSALDEKITALNEAISALENACKSADNAQDSETDRRITEAKELASAATKALSERLDAAESKISSLTVVTVVAVTALALIDAAMIVLFLLWKKRKAL